MSIKEMYIDPIHNVCVFVFDSVKPLTVSDVKSTKRATNWFYERENRGFVGLDKSTGEPYTISKYGKKAPNKVVPDDRMREIAHYMVNNDSVVSEKQRDVLKKILDKAELTIYDRKFIHSVRIYAQKRRKLL